MVDRVRQHDVYCLARTRARDRVVLVQFLVSPCGVTKTVNARDVGIATSHAPSGIADGLNPVA